MRVPWRWVSVLGAGVLAAVAVMAITTVRYLSADLHPERIPVPPAPAWPGLTPVQLHTTDGLSLAAWYLPPRAGAAVLLVHGLGQTRAALLPEAEALRARGLGVLLLDLRAHGESEGTLCTWGDRERLDVQAGLDFLGSRPEVRRLGGLGFSIGGAALALAAAPDPRVRCEVLSGMSVGLLPSKRYELRHLRPVAWWVAAWTYRYFDVDAEAVDPEGALRTGLPRPVLLVTGTDDASAPRWMTDRIEAAAPGPVALLVMQGAQHGHYAQAPGGPAYLERVGAFLEECLAVPDGGLVAP